MRRERVKKILKKDKTETKGWKKSEERWGVWENRKDEKREDKKRERMRDSTRKERWWKIEKRGRE